MSIYLALVVLAPILLYVIGALFLKSKKRTIFFAFTNIILSLAMIVGSIVYVLNMGTDYVNYLSLYSWTPLSNAIDLGLQLKVDYIAVIFITVNSLILLLSSIFDFIEKSEKNHITFETGVVQNILLLVGFLNLLYMSGNILTFIVALEGFTLGIIQIRRRRKHITDFDAFQYYMRFKLNDLLLYSSMLIIGISFGYEAFNFSADLDLLVLNDKRILISVALFVGFLGVLPRAGLLCFVKDAKSFLRQHSAISNLISIYSLAVVVYLLIVLSPVVEESQIFKNVLFIGAGLSSIYYLIKAYIQKGPRELVGMIRYADACFILMSIGTGSYAAATIHLISHIFVFYLIGLDMRYLGIWNDTTAFSEIKAIRKNNPIGAYSLLFLMVVYLGLLGIGNYATRLEVIWNAVNGPLGWFGYAFTLLVCLLPILAVSKLVLAFFEPYEGKDKKELQFGDYFRYFFIWTAALLAFVIGIFALPEFVIGKSGRLIQSKLEITLLMNNIDKYEPWYGVLNFWMLMCFQVILGSTAYIILYKKALVLKNSPAKYAENIVSYLARIEEKLVLSSRYVVKASDCMAKKTVVPFNKNAFEILGNYISLLFIKGASLITGLRAKSLSVFIATSVSAVSVILIIFILISHLVS